MLIIPIRTESEIRRTPLVNYGLLGANVLVFLLFSALVPPERAAAFTGAYLALHSDAPAFHQFFTYQFVHADIFHLAGNMLFLWVFGNHVNAKMGDLPYLLFYLAGGVFAAWGYALVTPMSSQLIGASGSIAAVTTAYLALAPRSRVTIFVWLFIFIHFFELRAMVVIGLKIVVWDNIIAPRFGGSDAVAHSAHLFGYFFGFVGALGMLLIRALPRDQFDMIAVWKRWNQRRQFSAAMRDPAAAARAQYGSVANIIPTDPEERARQDQRFDAVAELRTQIADALDRRNLSEAAALYEKLIAIDEQQCLSERHQLEIAREFYREERFSRAAAAFHRFLDCYPSAVEAGNVRLLLGIIYARDLREYEAADQFLSESIEKLSDQSRRDQCVQWLSHVRNILGRPAPEG
jgi:membrane associated rhomboid family serine protease/CRISPR/Cas system CSM-associated protein Csm2 small subunit